MLSLQRMKKIFVSLFAIFYLGISCGFAIDMHFCMGKFSSLELSHSQKDKCGKCGMDTKNSCCNDKVTVVKITDNQQLSSNNIQLIAPAGFAPHLFHSGNLLAYTLTERRIPLTDTSPPPLSGAFLCILNSVFTI